MTTARGHERAFTLIEMLVAMILLAGLLVVVSTVLMRSFGESERSREERGALKAARETFSQFQSDLKVAQSPDRDPRYVGNANELSGALLMGEEIDLQLPGQAAITLDVRDLIRADGTSVLFRSDVLPAPGTECVQYFVRDGDRAFVRQVMRYNPATNDCDVIAGEEPRVLMEVVQ